MKRKLEYAAIAAVVSYFCLPAFMIKSTGFNSGYFVTALLFALALYALVKKRIRLRAGHIVYAVGMAAAVAFVFLGWIINGDPKLGDLNHFVGMGQFFLGSVALSLLFDEARGQIPLYRIILKSILIVLAVNVIFVILQFAAFDISLPMIRQLYAHAGKNAPINAMQRAGHFYRAFGASIRRLFWLPFPFRSAGSSWGIACAGKRRPGRRLGFSAQAWPLVFAFSKTVMIGIFILLLLLLAVVLIWFRKAQLRLRLQSIGKFFAGTVAVCIAVAAIGYGIGRGEQVKYYYGFIIDPVRSLAGRYENIIQRPGKPDDTDKNSDNKKDPIKEETPSGIVAEAATLIERHPVIGVGPAQVQGEFLGDSQYVITLHDGGILAALMYGAVYGWMFLSFLIKKDYSRMLVITSLGIACLSLPILSYSVAMPLVAYCLSGPEQSFLLFRKKKDGAPDAPLQPDEV
ncbi:MAG: hypothetical protein ACLSAP_08250 [Oscillospiraceae bacterium]